MKSNRIIWIIVGIVVFATASFSVTTLRSQEVLCEIEDKSAQEKQTRHEFESQFPIAEYSPSENNNAQLRSLRTAKNKRYDKTPLVSSDIPSEPFSIIARSDHGSPLYGALPIAESNAAVIGQILDARAFVSNNKLSVYSEFTVRIDEVLKSDSSPKLVQGAEITIDREGGMVHYPNGNKTLYFVAGKEMPRVNKQYLLFLAADEISPNYQILTGYELKENKVFPLDGAYQFQTYRGKNISEFVKTVRDAIAKSPETALKTKE
ncbi:MAG TPA: hypothetical protein VF596_08845 [Pyrinomonadaceae bacterium]|jgi:hypothetical protein